MIGAIAAAVIPALISAAGTMYQNKKQEDYAREMSGTAYQRSTQDMLRAGLNPILAAGKGGADTPSVTMQNPAGGVGEAVSSARSAAIQKRLAEAQAKSLEDNAVTNRMAVFNQQAQYNLGVNRFQLDTERTAYEMRLLDAQRRATEAGAHLSDTAANKNEVDARLGLLSMPGKELAGISAKAWTELYRRITGVNASDFILNGAADSVTGVEDNSAKPKTRTRPKGYGLKEQF